MDAALPVAQSRDALLQGVLPGRCQLQQIARQPRRHHDPVLDAGSLLDPADDAAGFDPPAAFQSFLGPERPGPGTVQGIDGDAARHVVAGALGCDERGILVVVFDHGGSLPLAS